MIEDNDSIAGFAFAEARKQAQLTIEESFLEEPIWPKYLALGVLLLFMGMCLYFASIDILLLLWGHKTTATLNGKAKYEYVIIGNFDKEYYDFTVNGKKYETYVNYPCRRLGCVQKRTMVTVNYVSWNPALNKATYNPYAQ